jgi:hypothetical protein
MDSDRNLLFGVQALPADLITASPTPTLLDFPPSFRLQEAGRLATIAPGGSGRRKG